jgi:hypothetical protein
MGGHTLSKTQKGILGGALKGVCSGIMPRDLNSAKSYNCQESFKLSYGMGVGKWKIGLMHL